MWVRPGDEFAELLRSGFTRSAWRWECQGTYHEPGEREPLQAWRDGHPDFRFMEGWLAQIRGQRAEGKTFQRVRMLTEPLTEYLRWMTEFTYLNVEAGEDIRWIGQSRARELGAPTDDFHLLDDERVAIMQFDSHGVAGVEVTDEPGTLAEHRRWRDIVWPAAVPHAEQFTPTTRSP